MTDFASLLASSQAGSSQTRMPAKPLNFKSFAGTRDYRRSPPHIPPGQFTRRRSQVRVLSRPPFISDTNTMLLPTREIAPTDCDDAGLIRRTKTEVRRLPAHAIRIAMIAMTTRRPAPVKTEEPIVTVKPWTDVPRTFPCIRNGCPTSSGVFDSVIVPLMVS